MVQQDNVISNYPSYYITDGETFFNKFNQLQRDWDNELYQLDLYLFTNDGLWIYPDRNSEKYLVGRTSLWFSLRGLSTMYDPMDRPLALIDFPKGERLMTIEEFNVKYLLKCTHEF